MLLERNLNSDKQTNNQASHGGINHVIDNFEHRGLWQTWQNYGAIESTYKGNIGIAYPVFHYESGQQIATRFKNADKGTSFKYGWIPNKPKDKAANWYILPDTKQAIADNNGVAIFVNGEPALIAAHAGGIHNVITTTLSEVAVPDNIIEVFESLNIKTLHYIADKDKAGTQAAINWRDALLNSDIEFIAYELPDYLGHKADVNDLWIYHNFNVESFQNALKSLHKKLLPQPEVKPVYDDNSDFEDTPQGLLDNIAFILRNRGFSGRRNWLTGCSIFRDEKHPSFSVNIKSGVGHDHASNENYSPIQIAEQLGIDWKRYYPQKARKQGKKRDLSNDFSQWASPIELPTIEADFSIENRYVSAMDKKTFETIFNARSILIKSPIGTGKTSLLYKMIEAAIHRVKDFTPRILIVSHRQNLASDIHRRFNNLGFILYKDYQGLDVNWQGHNRIICSYDSLHKLSGQNFDIVAIDEFEQFIPHGWGGTMHKDEPYRASTTLLHFILNAKQFIGLDAHITQKSQDIVQQWRKGKVITLENTYRHEWGDLTVCQNDSAVIERAFNAVETANKPVVLLSSSRKITNRLYQLALDYGISPDDIILINSDTSSQKDIQNYLANLNESIKTTKLLILSPSVDTGYDIQTPVHGVYAIFNDKPLIATKMLQMLNRCRQAGERWVYVQYADNRNYETNSDLIEVRELSKAWNTAKRANFDYQIDPLQVQINRLYAIWQADENKQRNMLFSSFIAYAENEGYTLKYQDKQSLVFRDLYKAAKENRAERIKQDTLHTESIHPDQYRYLKLNGLADETSRAGLNRWHIEDTVGRVITPELYDTFHNPRQRAALHQFMNLQDDIERLKDFDRQEADNQTLFIKRKNLTVKFELIAGAINTVFGNEGLDSCVEKTADEIADLMTDYIKANMTSIALYLDNRADYSEKEVNILRRILKRAGIKLDYRQVMVNGERFYLYSIDQKHLAMWRDYARTGLIYRRLKADYGDKAKDYLKHVNIPYIRDLSNFGEEGGTQTITDSYLPQNEPIFEGLTL